MKNFTLIKRVIVLSLFSFLLVQCKKDETDKIKVQEQEKDLSQIITTNDNGVTLTEKDYQEFDKELNQRLEENRLLHEKMEREDQEYIKNGGRIDMENIPPPPSDEDYLPFMRPFDSFSPEEQKIMLEDKRLTITDNPTVEVQKRMLFNQLVERRKKKIK